jgi:hypothetical protein
VGIGRRPGRVVCETHGIPLNDKMVDRHSTDSARASSAPGSYYATTAGLTVRESTVVSTRYSLRRVWSGHFPECDCSFCLAVCYEAARPTVSKRYTVHAIEDEDEDEDEHAFGSRV